MEYIYYTDSMRIINTAEAQKFIVDGWVFEKNRNDFSIAVKINGKRVQHKIKWKTREDVVARHSKKYKPRSGCGYQIKVSIEPGIKIESFEVFAGDKHEMKRIFNASKKKLKKSLNSCFMKYRVDKSIVDASGRALVAGWAFSDYNKSNVGIKVLDSQGKEVEISINRIARMDVITAHQRPRVDIQCGFTIYFDHDPNEKYVCIFDDGHSKRKQKLRITQWKKSESREVVTAERSNSTFISFLQRGIDYTKRNGIQNAVKKIRNRDHQVNMTYQMWFEKYKVDKDTLEEQKKYVFKNPHKISVVVPAYNTPENFLKELIDSLIDQSYSNWELCIADGSESDQYVKKIIDRDYKKEKRIKYIKLDENRGISENTNGALAEATGEYVGLLDHDDFLTPNALFEVMRCIEEDDTADVIYSDEDKVDAESESYFQPHFKSDFNIDLLRSNNYICHFLVVRKALADEAGGFRKEYDGSQDYDFVLRCIEKARSIKHIPEILYHWRVHGNSTAEDPTNKMYCYDAGERAIQAHLDRLGIKGTVRKAQILGLYHIEYEMDSEPLVSIIIPNKDEKETLKTCIDSILQKSSYKNYEIIIVENNSKDDDIFDYYKKIDKNDKIKVVYWEKEFNYSAINNFGASHAVGEYLILLNNDVEIITEGWIEGMLSNCMRPEVGITGVKLYYPDDTIQHAGVIIGVGGVGSHAYHDHPKGELGYFGKAIVQCNVSAVTAACLMVERKVFDQVGGLEEKIKIAFNDVDFCLKVLQAGYLIVFNPNVELYHYESKSRGYEDTIAKVERFESEVNYIRETWAEFLDKGDPYYNKNMSLIANQEFLPREIFSE